MTNRQRFPDGHDKVAAGVLEAKASGGAVGCSHMKLRRLTRLISRHYDAHLSKCGLKTTQYSMLAIIADRGPLQQGELARVLSLDASTLTRNLRPLLEAGLVSVDAGRDARSRQVSATAAGRDLRMQARQHWKQRPAGLQRGDRHGAGGGTARPGRRLLPDAGRGRWR